MHLRDRSCVLICDVCLQDLLTPTAPFGGENAGLHVREDPAVGFFVEGLREYTVCSHQEVKQSFIRNLAPPTKKKSNAWYAPVPQEPTFMEVRQNYSSWWLLLIVTYEHMQAIVSRYTSSDEGSQLRTTNSARTTLSIGQAAALIDLGLQQRTTAQTTKNDISSRSHTVLTINLEQCGGVELPPFASAADVKAMAGRYAGSRARSKLVLVDLAGSERGKRSSIYLHQGSFDSRERWRKSKGPILEGNRGVTVMSVFPLPPSSSSFGSSSSVFRRWRRQSRGRSGCGRPASSTNRSARWGTW